MARRPVYNIRGNVVECHLKCRTKNQKNLRSVAPPIERTILIDLTDPWEDLDYDDAYYAGGMYNGQYDGRYEWEAWRNCIYDHRDAMRLAFEHDDMQPYDYMDYDICHNPEEDLWMLVDYDIPMLDSGDVHHNMH